MRKSGVTLVHVWNTEVQGREGISATPAALGSQEAGGQKQISGSAPNGSTLDLDPQVRLGGLFGF